MDITSVYAYLPPNMRYGVKIFEEVASTNRLLKTAACTEETGAVYLAQRQSKGRGRLGRSFFSPTGGIYLSMLLRPDGGEVSTLTARAALAVSDAVGRVCGIYPGIKWVNDLILDGRKLGGILVEGVAVGGAVTRAVVGVGLNVNTERFEGELEDKATSLLLARGERADIERLCAALIEELRGLMSPPEEKGEVAARYRSRCITLGREVTFTRDGRTLRGVAEDIDECCALLVRMDDGNTERISYGEVSVIPSGMNYTRK